MLLFLVTISMQSIGRIMVIAVPAAILALTLTYASFFTEPPTESVASQVKINKIDLTDTKGLFYIDNPSSILSGSGGVSEMKPVKIKSGAAEPKALAGKIHFQKVSPIDGIYYRSEPGSTPTITNEKNTTVIHVGQGLSILSLYDPLVHYAIDIGTTQIMPETRGTIVVAQSE